MIRGVVLVESLRLDRTLSLDGFTVTVVRRDVSAGAVGDQPKVWAFLEIEGPDDRADDLARDLAGALQAEGGWYADFHVSDDHVVVFADKVFRYRAGDAAGRAEVQQYGESVGVPTHQLDWSD